MPVVTFTTDFGTVDGYCGAMKGVVLSLSPAASLVDITHDVPPQDIAAGAFALAQAAPLFPPGTVHVAVVDPGVGSARAGVVVEAGGALFVGPDNGLLSLAARGARFVRRIENRAWLREPVSATFHGRDVFAPVAGRLSRGEPPREVGPELHGLKPLPGVPVVPVGGTQGRFDEDGAVLHVDRFGNLVTSFQAGRWARGPMWVELSRGERFAAQGADTYADVAPGALVVYDGSAGQVEIGVRDGSAAALTGARRGDPVRVRRDA